MREKASVERAAGSVARWEHCMCESSTQAHMLRSALKQCTCAALAVLLLGCSHDWAAQQMCLGGNAAFE